MEEKIKEIQALTTKVKEYYLIKFRKLKLQQDLNSKLILKNSILLKPLENQDSAVHNVNVNIIIGENLKSRQPVEIQSNLYKLILIVVSVNMNLLDVVVELEEMVKR